MTVWANFLQRSDQFDDGLVFTRVRQVQQSFHHIIETCMKIIVNIANSNEAKQKTKRHQTIANTGAREDEEICCG